MKFLASAKTASAAYRSMLFFASAKRTYARSIAISSKSSITPAYFELRKSSRKVESAGGRSVPEQSDIGTRMSEAFRSKTSNAK